MLNRDGIRKQQYGNPKQILANVGLQDAVGCIVPQSFGVARGDKKIAKAGTPINIDYMNLQTAAKKPEAGSPMNAVLLHDVDVTTGAANGTALIFGFVNVNMVETDVATAITAAKAIDGATPMIVFLKQ